MHDQVHISESNGIKVYRKIEGSIEGSQFTHCSGIAVRTSSTCSAIYSNGLI